MLVTWSHKQDTSSVVCKIFNCVAVTVRNVILTSFLGKVKRNKQRLIWRQYLSVCVSVSLRFWVRYVRLPLKFSGQLLFLTIFTHNEVFNATRWLFHVYRKSLIRFYGQAVRKLITMSLLFADVVCCIIEYGLLNLVYLLCRPTGTCIKACWRQKKKCFV